MMGRLSLRRGKLSQIQRKVGIFFFVAHFAAAVDDIAGRCLRFSPNLSRNGVVLGAIYETGRMDVCVRATKTLLQVSRRVVC